MREIKFRGKRLDNGEWVHGFYYSSDEMPKRGEIGHFIKCGLNEEYKVDPETVGQYTGLKDKNGKGIYEGDILRASDPKDPLTFVVQWYDYGGTNLLGINTEAFEVIGCRWDNPELMEGRA